MTAMVTAMTADARQTPESGLSATEVAQRVARGQTNAGGEQTSRSTVDILRENLLTRFNFILGVLLLTIIIDGQIQDATFGIILVINTLIGIIQELRAKHTLDNLAILHAPRARVMRDGTMQDLPVGAVVLDDLVELRTGDQLVADGIVRRSAGLQADESLLTGESEAVAKTLGDQLLSGSFVVAGAGSCQITAVGADAYARKLVAEARRFSLVRSDLRDGINRILGYITWLIVPVALLMEVSQLDRSGNMKDALSSTVAALVGMVPQGLVLLTSVAFAAAAVKLARNQVLVQQLPAVEGLARVDVICLDKTGTLTDGTIAFERLIPLTDELSLEEALGALADDSNANATLAAVGQKFAPPTWIRNTTIPFSSARKWSGASFVDHGSWIMGAPEMVVDSIHGPVHDQAVALAKDGARVLILAHTEESLEGEVLPRNLEPVALLTFEERIRPDAKEALRYFESQGVQVKVISGDNPHTVGAVASHLEIPGAHDPVDARTLPEDLVELGEVMSSHSVFGRVTPRQKQNMVKALQARGHTVAMTGDGVNDALALKLADIGIAMGSGTAATKAVAEVVLLDSQFSHMPSIVAEGRKVMANIERVGNLYITKMIWTTLVAILVGLTLLPYPFLPRHLTLVDFFTVGVPAFFLALAPNIRRYEPGFVERVLKFSLPAGAIIGAVVFATYWAISSRGLPLGQQRTAATLVAVPLSLCILVMFTAPFTWRRIVLIGSLIGGFVLALSVGPIQSFYALQIPTGWLGAVPLAAGIGIAALITFWLVLGKQIRQTAR
jgi:cation-transporting ATPase E